MNLAIYIRWYSYFIAKGETIESADRLAFEHMTVEIRSNPRPALQQASPA